MSDDTLAALLASQDQALAEAEGTAKAVVLFYGTLKAGGLPVAMCRTLTQEWFSAGIWPPAVEVVCDDE